MKTYRTADTIPDNLTSLEKYSRYLKPLLFSRGLHNEADIDRFLEPSYNEHLHSPWLLHDMEVAVTRILEAITKNEPTVIFSDYDCDGIPGGVILHDFFAAIKYENFTNYIPHRHFEGFGLSVAAVEKLAAAGAKLIVTIDCGTSDIAAVERANELGVDVIITDHHEPGAQLPAATALVNPKVGTTYPFTGLCGSAVVFKLIQAMIERGDFSLVPGYEKWWLDMVGIATIADMVPLIDENRVLAKFGLDVLRKSRRPGLQQLLHKNRTNQRYLTEDDIGFTIGPRINAASRMGTPQTAFALLAATDESEAGAHLEELEKLNNERKGLVAAMTKEVHGRIKMLNELPNVLVMGNPEWRPALVGLAANKLAEEHQRPAFLWGRDGLGVIKGSCRSGGGVSVVNLMNAISEQLLECGGHHMSGGFAVSDEHIFAFPQLLNDAYEELGVAALVSDEVVVDAALTLEDINRELLDAHRALAPFGDSNPKPLYEFKNVTPTDVSLFGKGKEHLKLAFLSQHGPVEAIAFFKTTEGWQRTPKLAEPLTLIGHVEQSFFMGRMQTRVRIVEIL